RRGNSPGLSRVYRERLAHTAPRDQADLLVGQVAARVLRPGVAVHLEGTHAEATAADVLPLTGSAAPVQPRRPIAQPRQKGIGEILPDRTERPLPDVSEGVAHPELVRVHVAQPVDVRDPHTRAVQSAA